MLISVLDLVQLPGTNDATAVRAAYAKAVTDALAGAKDGDRIYLPGVVNYQAPQPGWIVDKSLEIFGDGPGGDSASGTGTTLIPFQGSTCDVFVVGSESRNVPYIHIHDLSIVGPLPRTGRDGLRFRPMTDGVHLGECRLERLRIENLGGCGLRLGAAAVFPAKGQQVPSLWVSDIDVQSCGEAGISLEAVYVGELIRIRCAGNDREGLKILSCGLLLQACSFEGNKVAPIAGVVADLDISRSAFARVDACTFRSFAGSGTGIALRLDSTYASVVSGCDFSLTTNTSGAVGIDIPAPLDIRVSGPVMLLPNRFLNCGTAIRMYAGLRGSVVFPQSCSPTSMQLQLPADDGSVAPMGEASAGLLNGAGLLVPSFATTGNPPNPTANVQPGALFHSTTDNVIRARIGNIWKDVQVLP